MDQSQRIIAKQYKKAALGPGFDGWLNTRLHLTLVLSFAVFGFPRQFIGYMTFRQ